MAQNKPTGWNIRQNPKTARNTVASPKVELNVKDFDDLVQSQGARVRVYRTSYCPNVKSIDGAEHEIDCPLCHGSQFIDKYPIKTWAFIQSQSQEKNHMAEGLYDGNTVHASFIQGVELQYFTLVELEDFTEQFFERIKRQEGKIDVLKYKGLRVYMCVDEKGQEYFEGSDFRLDVNGNIQWKANKGPLSRDIYTINYETAVRFRALKAQHSNRFAQINVTKGTQYLKMNEQWLLQKEYLVIRKDIDKAVIDPNRIADPDEE